MKQNKTRKLKIARETLVRLEATTLSHAAGGATNERSVCACPTNQDTVCICETHICITLNYTGCALCDS